MASETDEPAFDIDSLRMKHDSDNEWQLRRKFIHAHHKMFPLEKLLCLSSCFVNITMMGCSYPPKVMEQIQLLSEDLQDDVKKIKENKLKHIMGVKFVKGQSEDDVGASSSTYERNPQSSDKPISKRVDTSSQNKTPKTMTFVKAGDQYKSTEFKSQLNIAVKPNQPTVPVMHSVVDDPVLNQFYKLKHKVREILSGVGSSVQAVQIAADKMRMTVANVIKPMNSQFSCEQQIDFVTVGCGFATNKKSAKYNACENTVERLNYPYLKIVNSNSKQELVGTDIPPKPSGPPFAMNKGKRVIESNASTFDQARRKVPRQNQPLDRFLIIEQMHVVNSNDVAILRQSADFNKAFLQYEFTEDQNVVCTVYINNEPIANGVELSKTMAKSTASTNTLEALRRMCWTVKVKQLADSDESVLTKDELGGNESTSGGASVTQAIPDSNIGNKLLKMMGWSGGGIGKTGQGIAEPVSMDSVVNREGLGLKTEQGIGKQFIAIVRTSINDYIKSNQQSDLVFSSDFTKEERAIIHNQAQKLGLKSRSHGTGNDRFLILSRKRSAGQLFDHIMQNGGSTSKYELFPPASS